MQVTQVTQKPSAHVVKAIWHWSARNAAIDNTDFMHTDIPSPYALWAVTGWSFISRPLESVYGTEPRK